MDQSDQDGRDLVVGEATGGQGSPGREGEGVAHDGLEGRATVRLDRPAVQFGTTIDMTWVPDLMARYGVEVTL